MTSENERLSNKTELPRLQFPAERMKILYGAQHFEAISADYDWLVTAAEVEPLSRNKRHV